MNTRQQGELKQRRRRRQRERQKSKTTNGMCTVSRFFIYNVAETTHPLNAFYTTRYTFVLRRRSRRNDSFIQSINSLFYNAALETAY